MIIRQCALVEGKNGPFVALPQKSFKKRDGTSGYAETIEFTDKETGPSSSRNSPFRPSMNCVESDTSKLLETQCLFCGKPLVPIRVHGHVQCSACGAVMERCCE